MESPRDAIAELSNDSIGWVLGSSARWFRKQGEATALAPDFSDPLLDDGYEVQAFDGHSVWSWQRSPDGDGRLNRVEVPAPADPVVRHTLLWGVVSAVEEGWARLAEGRIRAFWVPVEARVGERIVLRRLETATPADAHGNVRVAATLPLDLRAVPASETAT